jgi:hypothetical protein
VVVTRTWWGCLTRQGAARVATPPGRDLTRGTAAAGRHGAGDLAGGSHAPRVHDLCPLPAQPCRALGRCRRSAKSSMVDALQTRRMPLDAASPKWPLLPLHTDAAADDRRGAGDAPAEVKLLACAASGSSYGFESPIPQLHVL